MMQLMRDSASWGSQPKLCDEKRIGSYILKEVLGEGTTGTVHAALNTETGKKAAVKIVNKCITKKVKEALKEVRILEMYRHENLIELERVEEDNSKIYIFLQYGELGDLYSFTESHGNFDEGTSRFLFKQMVDVIDFCHKKMRICHHDVKLENFVMGADFTLKLIDFGFCSKIVELPAGGKKLLTVYDSSPAYAPLEVLKRKPHDESVDVFSLGVCLYYMLCGCYPFCDPDADTFDTLVQNVRANLLEFPPDVSLSAAAQDIIVRMLAKRKHRITLDELKEHAWFKNFGDVTAASLAANFASRPSFAKSSPVNMKPNPHLDHARQPQSSPVNINVNKSPNTYGYYGQSPYGSATQSPSSFTFGTFGQSSSFGTFGNSPSSFGTFGQSPSFGSFGPSPSSFGQFSNPSSVQGSSLYGSSYGQSPSPGLGFGSSNFGKPPAQSSFGTGSPSFPSNRPDL